VVSSKKKSTVMSPIRRQMKKRNPSGGQNGQLVHWWVLIHSGRITVGSFPAYTHVAQQQTTTDLGVTRCCLDWLLALAWGRSQLGQYFPYPVLAVVVGPVLSLPGLSRGCRFSTNASRLFLFINNSQLGYKRKGNN
jgi:hypothetical protein